MDKMFMREPVKAVAHHHSDDEGNEWVSLTIRNERRRVVIQFDDWGEFDAFVDDLQRGNTS